MQGVLGETEEEKGEVMHRWKEPMKRMHNKEGMDRESLRNIRESYASAQEREKLQQRIQELEEENERLKEMNKRAWDNGYLEATTALKEGEDGKPTVGR